MHFEPDAFVFRLLNRVFWGGQFYNRFSEDVFDFKMKTLRRERRVHLSIVDLLEHQTRTL